MMSTERQRFAAHVEAACCGPGCPKLLTALYLMAWGTATEQKHFFGEPLLVGPRDRAKAINQFRRTAAMVSTKKQIGKSRA